MRQTRPYPRWLIGLATGSTTLGWIQGYGLISWATFFTDFIARWLAVIVTLLLGGDTSGTEI